MANSAGQGYGGFWVRFLAYLVDSVIFFTLLVALAAGAAFLGDLGATVITAAAIVGPLLYWGLMQASARQATFGKALLGMKVTDADGQRLSLGRSLARELAKYVSAIPMMLGFVLAAFTGRKQALHDMIASTTVLRESPGHVLVALLVGLFGWIAPIALVMAVGAGLVAGMMGVMGAGLMAQMMGQSPTDQPKQITPRAPKAPGKAPGADVPAPAPRAALAAAGDLDTVLGTQLAGFEKPGTTRAGPAVLELDKDFLFGGDFSIKTYVPPFRELEGKSVTMVIHRVIDTKGADIYDAANSFEKDPFFNSIDLAPASSPVSHLAGKRRVRLKSGNDARNLERVEGVVKLNVAQKPAGATFGVADAGKSKSVNGVELALKAMKGKQADFQLGGDASRVVSVAGFGADQKPLRVEMQTSSGSAVSYTFSAPAARIEFVVAESFVKREFPFTLTRSSVAAPPGAAAQATATPAEPAKQAAAPEPPPQAAVLPKVAPAEIPAVAAAAKPAPAPGVDLPGPIQARTIDLPAPLAAAPGRPGPKYNDLMSAVVNGDSAGVNELIALGRWVDKPDSKGNTPLVAAVRRGDQANAEVLLKAGADAYPALAVARERRDAAMTSLLERYLATSKRP